MSAAQLKAHFEQYGAVVEALVMVDHNSQRSRGFGCVAVAGKGAVLMQKEMDVRNDVLAH